MGASSLAMLMQVAAGKANTRGHGSCKVVTASPPSANSRVVPWNKPLFTATATAIGGRKGRTQAADGSVSVDLSVPKEMGGMGKRETTPEQLCAAGYGRRGNVNVAVSVCGA
jgi:hypothetical protein